MVAHPMEAPGCGHRAARMVLQCGGGSALLRETPGLDGKESIAGCGGWPHIKVAAGDLHSGRCRLLGWGRSAEQLRQSHLPRAARLGSAGAALAIQLIRKRRPPDTASLYVDWYRSVNE